MANLRKSLQIHPGGYNVVNYNMHYAMRLLQKLARYSKRERYYYHEYHYNNIIKFDTKKNNKLANESK